jgi:hypothetical protein
MRESIQLTLAAPVQTFFRKGRDIAGNRSSASMFPDELALVDHGCMAREPGQKCVFLFSYWDGRNDAAELPQLRRTMIGASPSLGSSSPRARDRNLND